MRPNPWRDHPYGKAITFLVMQGHSYESAKALPPLMLQAIMEMVDRGLVGVDAYRQSEYRRYRWAVAEPDLSIDEFIPPPGATEEDLEDYMNERLERQFDQIDEVDGL